MIDPAVKSTAESNPTLNYGSQPSAFPTFRNWWIRSRADVQERMDGFWEFLGMVVAMLGGWRQIMLAVAIASFAGGLGICIEREFYTSGHLWMAMGGFIAGLLIPLKRKL